MILVQSQLCLVEIANDGLYSIQVPFLSLNASRRTKLGSDVYHIGIC
jgi:hypothetical protein